MGIQMPIGILIKIINMIEQYYIFDIKKDMMMYMATLLFLELE